VYRTIGIVFLYSWNDAARKNQLHVISMRAGDDRVRRAPDMREPGVGLDQGQVPDVRGALPQHGGGLPQQQQQQQWLNLSGKGPIPAQCSAILEAFLWY
jgi:hypothetical protein